MHRRGGRSRLTAPRRNRSKGPDRQEAARIRAIKKLGGEEAVVSIRSSCDSNPVMEGESVNSLKGLSEREIRSVIPVGGSRISRLRKAVESGIDYLHTRRSGGKPSHAFEDNVIDNFKEHCATWVLEDGFPCSHRLPRQYFTEPNITWKVIRDRYVDETTRAKPGIYPVPTHYFPGVRLSRTAVDVCDCCVRLKIQLRQPDLTEDERNVLLLEQSTHLDSAIAQRRFISNFIKDYSALHAPEQILPSVIVPDTTDMIDTLPENDNYVNGTSSASRTGPTQCCRVQIQAENPGGGITMPNYGDARPSADYFNNNLIIQNFVVADITNNCNNIYFYDEQAQGTIADALCSLRLLYHLTTLQNYARNGITPAEVSFSLLDNCVGQNKSKKVVLCFLLPGHSHKIAGRVVAWCRRAVRKVNLYTPTALVGEVNKINSVNSIFLDHNDSHHPFFVKRDTLVSKYFVPPPAGYTSNNLFEIDEGIGTARKTVPTPDEASISFSMVSGGNLVNVRKAVIAELFGPTIKTIWEALISSVQLSRHSEKTKSLAAKYFSIPKEYLSYYPALPDSTLNAPTEDISSTNTSTCILPSNKRPPGRPKRNKLKLKANQPSILDFFSATPTTARDKSNA
ncbi:LOW QUALITY PROTEIN: Cleavage inducible protein [Phytophthora megakarya]|uniref:Cleavage inducible protein n=1 Tax=Phytophthora megakarya TaxID=4795 RepID=A0A225W1N6_9STRA|nr:LOW QUALITY PROTEIN: Cleavage inducible protein [Phytophthora megakarya]